MSTKGISANRLELLQIADAVAREKSIDKNIVISAMEEAIQKALATQQREINHFKSMVNALRDEIELKKNLHEENLQKENQIKTMEFKELQETIIELRAELEDTNAR